MQAGEFVHMMGDTHIYANHVEPLKEQLRNAPRHFPVGWAVGGTLGGAVGRAACRWVWLLAVGLWGVGLLQQAARSWVAGLGGMRSTGKGLGVREGAMIAALLHKGSVAQGKWARMVAAARCAQALPCGGAPSCCQRIPHPTPPHACSARVRRRCT